ncbi:hypothetical protein N7527_006365 [Penicillium freii]|nr:hypothetical protein N7527_006365 [Penicillium freii]
MKLITEFESGTKQDSFRHVLGQIAEYMIDSRLKYGFLTTSIRFFFERWKSVELRDWSILP